MYDIIIVGGGPAGLCAAIYARRANKSVLIIEKGGFGGQITHSPKIENYPGYISMSGNELADKFVEQALEQGAEVELSAVTEIKDGEIKTVVTEDGEYEALAVIIATGAKHRMLGLPGEEKYVGEGISFCAVCDGAFYKDKHVAVIGGGNSALQEAILLSETCKQVSIIQNLPYLTGEKKLCLQVEQRENIDITLGTVVDSITDDGSGNFAGITVKDTESGDTKALAFDGMFVAIGLIPQNEAFKNVIKLNDWGYADSGEDCLTETKGIYVAGDCRSKRIRQVTTAIADGAVAALAACNYIDEIKR